MKTRFAPFNNGRIHAGNARTALSVYLLSMQLNSSLTLRIDDTKQPENGEHYVQCIMDDLKWLGIRWNEIYRQSQASALYNEVFTLCRDAGIIYPCYETHTELANIRERLKNAKQPPVYKYSHERNSTDQAQDCQTWRFKLPNKTIIWDDMIKGQIKVSMTTVSDPIICVGASYKYQFASIVDDLHLGMTHIIRGEDHIVNTAIQIAIAEQLKTLDKFRESPTIKWGSLPLLQKELGKFSKRHKSESIYDLKSKGAHPLAIAHYLCEIGNSDPLRTCHTLKEMSMFLSINSLSSSAAPKWSEKNFDKWQQKILNELSNEQLYEFFSTFKIEGLTPKIMHLIRDNAFYKEDVIFWTNVFNTRQRYQDNIPSWCVNLDCQATSQELINAAVEKSGLTKKDTMKQLRYILTGCYQGPRLIEVINLMPNDLLQYRLSSL